LHDDVLAEVPELPAAASAADAPKHVDMSVDVGCRRTTSKRLSLTL
jgi:hypothetical protein